MQENAAAKNDDNENVNQNPNENTIDLSMTSSEPQVSVKSARFSPLDGTAASVPGANIDLLFDVNLELTVELGSASISVKDVLQLGPGSVIELNRLGGEPLDILINGSLIARGEVMVVDENYGVRVTELVGKSTGAS